MDAIDKFDSRKNDYQTIIEYYKSLFEYVDLFHFNSSVTETVYRHYLTDIKGKVVPRYTASDLEEIYKNTSLVIVPSQWYETFSFVTLEALSYGVPVLVSNKVGTKSIVANYDSSFIFNTKKELKDKLEMIMQNRSDLVSYHNRILSLPWNHSMEEHSNEIGKEVYGKSF